MTDPTPPDANCQHCGKQRGEHGGKVEACPGRSWASTFEPKVPDAKCSQELPKSGAWGVWAVVDYDADVVPAELNDMLALIPKLSPEQRAALGKALNPVREDILAARGLLQQELAASRRNEALRAQERDEAIASGKVLVEANLRHFNTATENHNRAEALWNELVEVAAQAKEWERRFNWKADASNTELAEMTKRAEAAEQADTGLLRRCEVGENQLAREQKRGQFDYEQAEKVRGERDDARNEIASVTAERDALREDMKTVAERQREACAKAIERNWAYPISKVRCTPLVIDAPVAEREENVMAAADAESDAHQAKMAALSREDDAWWHPAVAMANEAIREENDLDRLLAGAKAAAEAIDPCNACHARIRDLESQLTAALAEGVRMARQLMVVRTPSELVWFWQGQDDDPHSLVCHVVMSADTLRAILAERDAAVENSKSTMREGQARAITWAAKTMYDGAWSLQRGYHVKLSKLADLVRSGNVTP